MNGLWWPWPSQVPQLTNINSDLGTDGVTKTDEFSEKFQRGRGGGVGVIFNPKIYVADFGPLNGAFSA